LARLIKTRVELEGVTRDESTIVEAEAPHTYPAKANLKIIGREQPKIDGFERVTGRAAYTLDIHLPGMLYARVLRSPFPHARIKKIEVSQAVKLPGVRGVITYQNASKIPWLNNTSLLEPILRYAGDEVAAVAADDDYIATDALGLIEVDYEQLPFIIDPKAALGAEVPKIHREGNLVNGMARRYERGSVRSAFDAADYIVEEVFQTQSALHNCLEPHGTVASWSGDELTVWESTQSIFRVQDDLVEAFQLPRNKVRVICQYMGSGFGSKQYSGKWAILAALLARQTGRPVRLMYDRHEENLAAGNRAPTIQHLKIAAGRDGVLKAIELQAVVNIGAYGWGSALVEGPAQVMYACQNVRSEVRSVFTNTGPARSFRGPGYVEGSFALESLMDELALIIGIDPIELRLKNYATRDQRNNLPYSANHLDECYRKGAEMIGWQGRGERVGGKASKRRALGMAGQVWGGGGGPPAYAWVRINFDGSVEVITGSQDIGTGTRTVMAQIAAEELGMEPDKIVVRLGDTGNGPYDPVSWGSMTVSSVGPAVRQAAIDARNQLKDIVAGFLNKPIGSIRLKDGQIYTNGDSHLRVKTSEIVEQAGEFTIIGKGAREPNHSNVDLRTFGAQFADVEVDVTTGEVKVHKIVTVHDFGRVINRLGSQNQAEGAVVQGIGFALTEKRVIDERNGIVLNANLEDYLVPTDLDFNEIECAFIDAPDNLANSLGAKGLGEPALIPTAPAIANALRRATGTRFLSLPITRDKILERMK